MYRDSEHQCDFSADHYQQDVTKDGSYSGTQVVVSQHMLYMGEWLAVPNENPNGCLSAKAEVLPTF